MNYKLIVGANSAIVKRLRPELVGFDYASHREIGERNLASYTAIFVFSWDRRSLDGNLNLLARLPAASTVLISTTAVFATQRRRQWNKYPRHKLEAEKYVLERGGSVIRLGVTEDQHGHRSLGHYPRTGMSMLQACLNEWKRPKDGVINLFRIEAGQLCGMSALMCRLLLGASNVLPALAPIQMMIQGVAKALRFKTYGYTADANRFLSSEILIGYGALGAYYDRLCRRCRRLILVSGRKDYRLDRFGFSNTFIGFGIIGLARIWHGVETEPLPASGGLAHKRVPLVVRRPKPRGSRTLVAHVESVYYWDGCWRVAAITPQGKKLELFSTSLSLAAGPLENARLLNSLAPTVCHFSDHEIGMVGRCPGKSAIKLSRAKLWGPLVTRGKSLMRNVAGFAVLLEFRPFVKLKHSDHTVGAAIYLDSTAGIFTRVFRSLSLERLNEAIFNKFGVAFYTKSWSVFCQVAVQDCIRYDPTSKEDDKVIQRVRLSDSDWDAIVKDATQAIPHFESVDTVVTVDGQHIMGGAALLNSPAIQGYITQHTLRILGSPTTEQLDACHHTRRLQQTIRCPPKRLLVHLAGSPRKPSGHEEIVEALVHYYGRQLATVSTSMIGFLAKVPTADIVLFQKSAVSNLWLLCVARWSAATTVLYIHEPLTIAQRLRKGVPFWKASLITAFQWLESRLPHSLVTGNAANKVFFGRPLDYAPLLFLEEKDIDPWESRSREILYFGRLDSEKYFVEFTEIPLTLKIIATQNLNVPNPGIEVRKVSKTEKARAFRTVKYIWCVQRNSLTQSAVLLEALRYGCCPLISDDEPLAAALDASEYIPVPKNFSPRQVMQAIAAYEERFPRGPRIQSNSFHNIAGRAAFTRFWKDVLGARRPT